MVYMLLPVDGPRSGRGGAGMTMTGMGASARPGSFPALAVVLALFMLGYVVWTTDRLTALARARAVAADPGGHPGQRLPAVALPTAALPASRTHDAGGTGSASADVGTQHGNPGGRPVLAPKLAACGKLAMSVTMGYMLILMF
jgi:hypothetical protein